MSASIEVSKKKNEYTCLELFCGCGGMTIGLMDAGIKILVGIDNFYSAIQSCHKNFKHRIIYSDIEKIQPSELKIQSVDIIAGGPPCQGFSIAGRRDPKDPRNNLFTHFVNYINYFLPKVFILENVVGIMSFKLEDGSKLIEQIKKELSVNFNITINKLKAEEFEVPQTRTRIIIIGVNKKLLKTDPPPIKPPGTAIIPVSTILIPEELVDKKYFLSETAMVGIRIRKKEMKKKGYGFGAKFLNPENPSYTIPARYYKDGYDALVKYSEEKIRKLTIDEIKKIQTFPDDYELFGSNKDKCIQIGNAVPCKLAYYIGKYVINLLDQILASKDSQ